MSEISLLLLLAGYIVGQGAVTVIDFHGLKAINSEYWTRSTISAHKITKPLIWLGILLKITGEFLVFKNLNLFSEQVFLTFFILDVLLITNGLFLTFVVSPYLLKMENENPTPFLLPTKLKIKIALSLILSVVGWWGSLIFLVMQLV